MDDPNESLRERLAHLEDEVRALRAFERAPYRAIVEDMSELVVRWRPDGTRVFVNDAYCRLFDTPREELVGTSFWPLVSDEDRVRSRSESRASAHGPRYRSAVTARGRRTGAKSTWSGSTARC